MMRRLGLFFVLLAIAPTLAAAHGPSRKKEITTIEINAPAEKIWAVIGNYQDMGWHPDIGKTEAKDGNEPEVTTRKLTFKSGAVFTDKLTRYEPEAKVIAFLTDVEDHKALPVEGYSTTLSVKSEGDKSIVEWKGAFYRGYVNNDPPPELSDEAAIKAVTAFQKAGLEALKKKLEGGG
jgi:hypothetical protein